MNFKQVKPYPCFVNGAPAVIENINLTSIEDNLENYVKFKYTLTTSDGAACGAGIYELDAETYPLWDASANGAYRLVCEGIGLELVDVSLSVKFV